MEFEFTGEVIEWRGPAPFYYVRILDELTEPIKAAAKGYEYWGQVAVIALIGETEFTTALFPKDGCYLLPLKAVIRKAEGIDIDDHLQVSMDLNRSRR